MNDTKIEWTDRTWNPVTGCTKVSPGCDNCYAEGIARRFAGSKAFPQGFDVTLHPERLTAPLRWRTPARVFVNSMSDLFHDDIPDDFIAKVFAVMAATPQHTYQILTKRHGRMRALLGHRYWHERVTDAVFGLPVAARVAAAGNSWDRPTNRVALPLPNVWLGVSVEDQKRADLRVPALLETPAAVRFLSCEPLLGAVDLSLWLTLAPEMRRLHWVIVGGESGAGARRMELDWAEEIVEQCQSALGTAVFVKQLGSAHGPHKGGDIGTWPAELQVRQYPTAVSA